MKKFEEGFLKILVNRYGFYIKDYFSTIDNSNNWIAVSEQKDFVYCVIIGSKENINSRLKDARETVEANNNKRVIMNSLILEDSISYEIQNLQCNKLIYSLKENKVVYSDESCKLLIDVLNYYRSLEDSKKNRFKNKKITYSIIASNVIIYLITAFISGNILDIDIYTLLFTGAKFNPLIDIGQVWRLITCTFLHGGITHLFFNMYSLNVIGGEVERYYGIKKYLLIYLFSGLGGSIFSYIFNAEAVSVGASGAVFGLLGAMLYYGIKNRATINKRYIYNIMQVIVVNVVIGLSISNIDNAGHVGGLIFGMAMAFIVSMKVFNKENNKI